MVDLALAGVVLLLGAMWTFLMWMFPTLRYGLPLAWTTFFLSGVLHEFGHGIANGLTGGTWGFTSTAGNIIGGYGLQSIYAGVMPVFYVNLTEIGDWGWMLLGGPWMSILLGVLAARLWNWTRLSSTAWRDLYPVLRWLAVGFIVRMIADAIYLFPIDVFPSDVAHANGDGMALYNYWQQIGWDWSFGAVVLNAEYIVGILAVVVAAYHTWLFIATSQVMTE